MSPTSLENRTAALESRIIALETALALQDRAVERLTETVTAQQQVILRLEADVALLGQRLRTLGASRPAGDATPDEDPPPPHYGSGFNTI